MRGSGQVDCGVHMRGFGHIHMRGTRTYSWYTYVCVVLATYICMDLAKQTVAYICVVLATYICVVHIHLRGTHTYAWYTYICVVHIHMRGSGQVHMRGFGHVHMRGTRTYAWYTYICVVLAKQTVASEVCDKAVVVV
jgi:hypothetical protein